MDFNAYDFLKTMQKSGEHGKSFVGIDIGASSIKIVQLALYDDVPTLETYGEISNTHFVDREIGDASRMSEQGALLSDLLHEVRAQSRRCSVAIPLSQTLINTLDLPKRDPEQMRLLVPSEAQKYIPVSIKNVMLDWYALPEEETSAFDTVKPQTKVETQLQKVMVVAVTNETAHKLGDIVNETALTSEFYEIEMFSTVRSCGYETAAPTLILDLGASSTKAYVVNEHWVTLIARPLPIGGQSVTEAVMKSLSYDFHAAEQAKCAGGVSSGSSVLTAITVTLTPLWTYVSQMLEEYIKRGGKPIERVMLSGGGAYMPGIVDLISSKLSLKVELVRAFERTRGPMILENTLREDGPRFAVAVGLALRGIGR